MKQTGILLIHGLMGSPREYLPLEAVLQAEGYHTRSVTLPGHGFGPSKEFAQVRTDDILEHCLKEYNDFAEDHDDVVLIGHSLGGLCTLLTAAENPHKLSAVMTFSTPYEHAYIVNNAMGWLSVPLKILLPGIGYAPACRTGFERPVTSPFIFPKLLDESRIMFRYLQERIEHIRVPVCLAHSIYDLSIPYGEMDKLATMLTNAPRVNTITLENSGHQIFPYSKDKDLAIESVLHFLNDECHYKPRRFKRIKSAKIYSIPSEVSLKSQNRL